MATTTGDTLRSTSSDAAPDRMVTADGVPLKTSLRRAERRRRTIAFLLVLPLLTFIMVSFVIPIGEMMWRSVDNPLIVNTLPRTVEALRDWDGEDLPPEAAYAAMVEDLRVAQEERAVGRLAVRLNYEMSGARSLLGGAGRRAAQLEAPYKEALIDLNARWGEPRIWRVIQREGRPLTAAYYVSALDLTYDEDGNIVRQDERQRIYLSLFTRTLIMSVVITALTLLLGFPISYLLATLPLRYSNLLMIFVLLPFWTSLLVRTTSWIVLLQQQGVINHILVNIGILDENMRLQMIHNWIGTVIAMTHILLPFMVLPLYSVMKTIPPSYMRAARSLGANNWTAFWRVYVPQTVPGMAAGGILVFIISIGYYITPALVGGQSGQMISNLIAYHMQSSLNWGLAAALGTILLVGVLVLYWAFNKVFGADNVKLG
ncbi:putative spermidine/putrescine transport system permease protein [Natronocella acetinitrilica]|uniref:Spermidine/putrescine transport system permease protein n=1 Tax=Natronocella acetinitrilica TaxID=414046 RepID=A0AAE3G293_9GAMM|nr:ABC transporter permease [Natronocella acetinitrilica]MCP1673709.1 putative spermidine/putrescine transport system permease protein [Natronocella acetinitrilica]